MKSLIDYEKNVLINYTLEDNLIFGSTNQSISNNLLQINEKLKNPYTDLYDWIQDEEVEVEGMMEAIRGYNDLFVKKQNLITRKKETETLISELQIGKKSVKTIFSFKSSTEDLAEQKNLNVKLELELKCIDHIINTSTLLLQKNIEWFKNEKIKSYHENLLILTDVQKENSEIIHNLWKEIREEVESKNKS